eukprot:1629240-Prymnesium_polylepis.1
MATTSSMAITSAPRFSNRIHSRLAELHTRLADPRRGSAPQQTRTPRPSVRVLLNGRPVFLLSQGGPQGGDRCRCGRAGQEAEAHWAPTEEGEDWR